MAINVMACSLEMRNEFNSCFKQTSFLEPGKIMWIDRRQQTGVDGQIEKYGQIDRQVLAGRDTKEQTGIDQQIGTDWYRFSVSAGNWRGQRKIVDIEGTSTCKKIKVAKNSKRTQKKNSLKWLTKWLRIRARRSWSELRQRGVPFKYAQ